MLTRQIAICSAISKANELGSSMKSALIRLSEWYFAQCDDLWEHHWGLSITTLDNPGFFLKIELTGTKLENAEFERIEFEMNDSNRWYTCFKDGCEFHAAGAPSQIEVMIEHFLSWESFATVTPGRNQNNS